MGLAYLLGDSSSSSSTLASIRTEEGCYGIWRLTIQRLNPLVKLHQTRKIKPTRTQALLTHPYLHSQAYNSNHNQMLKPKVKRINTWLQT
jgi:hypothetical protein